ncbi:DUF3810 domain-containing protein [Mucilaginibacter terrae]|uniref:DUF3810 domain-containing protein n=1 Tax=Mucilaginibacter terrae TaxID=1955052 RepID=UPI0036255068
MIISGANKALSVKPYLLVILSLTLLLLTLFTIGNHPYFVEKWYARGLYPYISHLFHSLLGWFPISLGDILYVIIVLYLLYFTGRLIYKIICKKCRQLGVSLLKLVIGLQVFISAFYLLWGMNYSRPPASVLLNLTEFPYTLAQLTATTSLLIDSTNAKRANLQTAYQQATNSSIYTSAIKAVKHIGNKHQALQSYHPTAKPSLFTPLLNYMGTAGYFNPFTGEAQVNYSMPLVNQPVTACHEMAHQMGFAREDEANFIGFLAGINSTDRLLQYSAYYLAMEEFLHQVRQRDTVLFHQLKTRITQHVKQDMKADQKYWLYYQSKAGYVTGLFYDQFLKVNKQPEGLRTYNRMIKLTLAYYKRQRRF